MRNNRIFIYLILALVFLAAGYPELIVASEESNGHVKVSNIFFWLVLLLIAAKGGGELFERWNQPAVLGELVFGVVLGNLSLLGYGGFEVIKSHPGIAFAAEVGVILLLFEVGLESNLNELLSVGRSAILVAILGVVAPMLLGYGASSLFLQHVSWHVHLFVGATLAATSVGITARVLKDLGKMHTPESRIILAAAVLDDVLGLIVLAAVSGLIVGPALDITTIDAFYPTVWIIIKSIGFLLVAVILGKQMAGKILTWGARFKVKGMPVVLTLCYCFIVSGLAELVGLAPIVGAFSAGLVLDKTYYRDYHHMQSAKIEDILGPISSVLVPVFFVLMGLKVDLSAFNDGSLLLFSLALCVVAIVGKQLCSLGVLEKGLNRFVVGAGMIPRGEVGLIFAGIGASTLVAGQPVFSPDIFSALVLMVMVTTLITPPLIVKLFRTPLQNHPSNRIG